MAVATAQPHSRDTIYPNAACSLSQKLPKHIELSSNPCIGGDPMALAWRMDCNRSRLKQQDVRLRYVGSCCAMTA
nr:conserved hypothetical protein [Xanthomonas citri pv. citri]